MKLSTMNPEKIEFINSLGPFNHSIWKKDRLTITSEESLAGRARFLSRKIGEILEDNFSRSDLSKMSIIDVGCYDGWLLHQLSRFPFVKLTGVEPRKKNIEKGIEIRKILNIKTSVEFKKGSLGNLPKKQFDIVLCAGTLHHVESIPTALRNLDSICKRMIILETVCLPSRHITTSLKRDIEMKDVIYQFKQKMCGITGQKYESSYYDGSSAESTVVSIPSIETLLMYLDVLGYNQIKIAATPSDFKNTMKENWRPSQEVLIYAIKDDMQPKSKTVRELINDYELGLIETNITSRYVSALFEKYCLNKKFVNEEPIVKKIMAYIDGHNRNINSLKRHFKEKYEFEIIKNMKFNPVDKIALEYAKLLYLEKKYDRAIDVLKRITQKMNADWRSVYRSFYLLSKIYARLKNTGKGSHYRNLCKRCNPDFGLLE